MSKENFLSEASMKDSSQNKLKLNIRDDSVTNSKLAEDAVSTEKIQDGNITTPKIANASVNEDKIAEDAINTKHIVDNAVTTEKIKDNSIVTSKIEDKNVTTEKLNNQSVTTEKIANENVTTEKLANNSVSTNKIKESAVTREKMADNSIGTSQVVDENITKEKLSKDSVSTDKIIDGSVTNDKVADNTLTKEKLDPELRQTLEAATGLPDDLIKTIQDVDVNLAKLNDTVYPITLSFSVNQNVGTMKTDVRYSSTSEGKPFTPDTLEVTKQVNDNATTILANAPTSSGSLTTDIQGSREIFKFSVTKQGRTGKSTGTTRYLCYYGSNSINTISDEILNSLTKASTTGVSFNPKVATKDNDYIWLVVPSYLTISRVTSAGFDVTLATPQTITNSLGTFKAYRTLNPLTANTWNLVIS